MTFKDSKLYDLIDMRDEVVEVEEAGVETLVVQARVECHPVGIIVLKLQTQNIGFTGLAYFLYRSKDVLLNSSCNKHSSPRHDDMTAFSIFHFNI